MLSSLATSALPSAMLLGSPLTHSTTSRSRISIPSRHILILMSLGAARVISTGNGCHLQDVFMSGSDHTIPSVQSLTTTPMMTLATDSMVETFSWKTAKSQLPSQIQALTPQAWDVGYGLLCLVKLVSPCASSAHTDLVTLHLPRPIVSVLNITLTSSAKGTLAHLRQPSSGILVFPYPHGRLQDI